MSKITTRSEVLQDDQKFALMKFRRSVSDIITDSHDDYFLLRWLRARNWNPTAAEKMLRDSMKYRERWSVDKIEEWTPPQPLQDYIVHGLSGFDKDGAPFIVIPFGPLDMYGLLHTVSRSDIIRYTVQQLEAYLKLGYKQSQEHGQKARQLSVLFDMDGFNMKQYTCRPVAEVIISMIKMYEANYPEILKFCYIINAPKVFAFAFNIVKKFLDEYTLSKIQIFKADPKKWQPMLLERVDLNDLPKHYGGEKVDENGDPKCAAFIKWGGKVPKDSYKSKDTATEDPNANYVETDIKKGGRLKLEFDCKNAGCFLKWEFRTFDHDIKFGVKRIDEATGEDTEEIPLNRVSSHQMDEAGFITCQPNCKYKVLFDNSYSYLTTKKIRYSVYITEPIADLAEDQPEN